MPPPKGVHGLVEAALLARLDRYLDERAVALGWSPEQGLDARTKLVGFVAGGEFGVQFSVPDDAAQIRGADGAYVSPEQMARANWNAGDYFPEVPVLVIEIVSESESAGAVAEKVQDYLAGGAQRVWCVYPRDGFIQVYHLDLAPRLLRIDQELTDDLLPGFVLPLRLVLPGG